MRGKSAVIALVAALLLTGAGTAVATRPPATITGRAASLHPEGVAWDPTRQALLVGSSRHGTVSVVRPDGRVSTLVSDPRLISTFGLRVDAARNRLLVTFADIGIGERSGPDTTYRQSGVGIYDLRTGAPLHLVDLAIGEGRHGANDLSLDRAGNAYVTDPASDALYRVDPAGRASVLVRDPRLASPTIGANGIAWHPDGYLLVVRYGDGALLRVSPTGRIDEVRLDRPLVGGDGIALRPDGTLVVVTNGLGGSGENAVTLLRPNGSWRSATVLRRVAPWRTTAPTTVAVTPRGSYVVSGDLDELLAGTTTDSFTLDGF
ncbi:MAG: SMP-30/gluconolactonase/LRE family protein [Umezawaea sp.]